MGHFRLRASAKGGFKAGGRMPPGITAARAGVASNDAFLASYVARVVTISSTRTERCCRSSRLPTFQALLTNPWVTE